MEQQRVRLETKDGIFRGEVDEAAQHRDGVPGKFMDEEQRAGALAKRLCRVELLALVRAVQCVAVHRGKRGAGRRPGDDVGRLTVLRHQAQCECQRGEDFGFHLPQTICLKKQSHKKDESPVLNYRAASTWP